MSATTPVSTRPVQSAASPWRSVGLWMSALLIAYLFFNVLRATADPAGFAAAFGVPLANPGDDAFVLVYAIRTLFLGLFGLVLLVRRSYAVLALFLLVATVMPLGDALLVWQRGGEPATGEAARSAIARHIVITGIVLLTWFLTSGWVRRASAARA